MPYEETVEIEMVKEAAENLEMEDTEMEDEEYDDSIDLEYEIRHYSRSTPKKTMRMMEEEVYKEDSIMHPETQLYDTSEPEDCALFLCDKNFHQHVVLKTHHCFITAVSSTAGGRVYGTPENFNKCTQRHQHRGSSEVSSK